MTKEEMIEAIKGMTVIELKELVDALQEEFGVSAAMPVMAGAAGGGAAEAEEEPSEFNVVIISPGDKKIQVIKSVREIVSSLGLKEAKDLVDSAPEAIVEENVTKERAEEIKAKLVEAGATIDIKPA